MQKTVLVTGCSSGIGLESALDLTRQGFRVLAACRKAEDVARMQDLGLTGILLDLDDPQSVERAAAEVIALTDNRLYGLFNNAGYGVYGPLNTISRQQMEQQFSANFFGAHQLTMLLLPAMTPHGEGRIVMTSSVMGLIASPGRGAYAASKYALEAWSDALRMELRHSGIQVSLIEPGPIRTRFTDNVNQTQSDKPVEIRVSPPALPSGRRRWWKKCAMLLPAINQSCAIRSPWSPTRWRCLSACCLPARWTKLSTAELKRGMPPPCKTEID
ncbi:short chain dehydrogenase [Klebsiella pneumoniae]|uniref:Short chain dehydrogenase n=3 Tax=Enterobacteriaceae TaxID=543 RepID=A0A2X3C7M3_KLEPN|nr:short chain dehydrogenase [Klebsiella pneumoniae]